MSYLSIGVCHNCKSLVRSGDEHTSYRDDWCLHCRCPTFLWFGMLTLANEDLIDSLVSSDNPTRTITSYFYTKDAVALDMCSPDVKVQMSMFVDQLTPKYPAFKSVIYRDHIDIISPLPARRIGGVPILRLYVNAWGLRFHSMECLCYHDFSSSGVPIDSIPEFMVSIATYLDRNNNGLL